jgi:hypothetical protein
LPEVQATLGHGNIMTTSGYLHARPESSSGLKLDPFSSMSTKAMLPMTAAACAVSGPRKAW